MIGLIISSIGLFGYLGWFIYHHWYDLPQSIKTDEIYYDPRLNKIFQVRQRSLVSLICGGMCDYYRDSQTNIQKQRMSILYLLRCKRIINCDQCDFLYNDGIGWRTKRS